MLTVTKLLSRGHGLSPVLLKRAATVQLPWAQRRLARFEATDSQGRALDVNLPPGSVVRGGDVLVAEDGSLIRVEAQAEAVMAVTPCPSHGGPTDLLRAAYQLGRRQVLVELQAERLQLVPDAAVAALLRGMHLVVDEAARAPFEPEAVAPGSKPVPIAVHAAPAPHVHGPGCGHHHHH